MFILRQTMDNLEKKHNLVTGLDIEVGEKLPAIEVKNEVVWVNDDVEMPFKFEEGKPTKIGVFLTTPNELEPAMYLRVLDNHFRSAILGKVVFRDKEGNLYRDVDIKGMGPISKSDSGNLEVEFIERGLAKKHGRGKTPWGFLDWGYAETDRDMSEFFIKKGLRTHRVLAIDRLDEIVVGEREKISVSKARKLGYIKYTTEPVIEVRAFGTKARIADVKNQSLLEDAKHMVAQELGKDPKDFSGEKYLKWFAQTLGKQVAIIHNAGFIHGYLTDHNVTLDCRVVDLDSVKEIKIDDWFDNKEIRKDLRDAIWSIKDLCRKNENLAASNSSELASDFFDNYIYNSNLVTRFNSEDINNLKDSLLNEVFE